MYTGAWGHIARQRILLLSSHRASQESLGPLERKERLVTR
jgi:hypothetical protein